jgi:polyphosphate glucokinase
MHVLVVDVGGRSVKVLASGEQGVREFVSGPGLTPEQMVEGARKAADGWTYDHIALGFPGPVRDNRPVQEPVNLGTGWVGFDYEAAFGLPVRMINDAAMQALGSYHGGRMLFIGLGTGMGSAMVVEGIVQPLELAHLPYRKGTFEDYVGRRGRERMGKKRWLRRVREVLDLLNAALLPDYVVLGGGKADDIDPLPAYARRGDNDNAFKGGFLLWDTPAAAISTETTAPR